MALSSSFDEGISRVSAWFAFATSSAVRTGELDLFCPITPMAALSSAKFSRPRPLDPLLSSSSLEFCVESGGEMTAPDGICESSVTGGGDCLMLLLAGKLLVSLFSLSAVPGGVGSREGSNDAVLTEPVRRCSLVKYDADLGSSGRFETGGPSRPD